VAEPLVTRRFLLLTLANLVFFTGITSSFVLPVQLEQLGASRAEIGQIVGVFGVASLIFIPATGALADRFGRRPFMLAGSLLWLAVAVGFSFVTRLGPDLYLLRAAQGAAFSLAFVAVNARVADLAPPGALGRAIAIFGTATLLAHAVGPSLGELFAERFGFPAMWRAAAATAAASFLLFAAVGGSDRKLDRSEEPSAGMLELALRSPGRLALVGSLGMAVAFGSAIHFIPVFVRARGLESHTPFFVGYVVAAMGVRLVAGGLGDRLGQRPVAAASAACFGLSVIGFATVHASWQLALFALAYGAAHGFAYPAMNALFVEQAPERARGRAMALFNLSFNVGITISAFAAGEIAHRLGYPAMWILTGAVALLGSVPLLRPRAGP
jgi:MFS family permease